MSVSNAVIVCLLAASLALAGCGSASRNQALDYMADACALDNRLRPNVPWSVVADDRRLHTLFRSDYDTAQESAVFIRKFIVQNEKAAALDETWSGVGEDARQVEKFVLQSRDFVKKYVPALPDDDKLGERLDGLWKSNFEKSFDTDFRTLFLPFADEVESVCYTVGSRVRDREGL